MVAPRESAFSKHPPLHADIYIYSPLKEIIHFNRNNDNYIYIYIYIYRVNDKYIESEYQTGQYSMFLLINTQIIPKIKQKTLSMYLSVTLNTLDSGSNRDRYTHLVTLRIQFSLFVHIYFLLFSLFFIF